MGEWRLLVEKGSIVKGNKKGRLVLVPALLGTSGIRRATTNRSLFRNQHGHSVYLYIYSNSPASLVISIDGMPHRYVTFKQAWTELQ